MNFQVFKLALAKQFERMQKHSMFRVKMTALDEAGQPVDVTKSRLKATYLASFPEGTNPMFRERTEHDCNCCMQFIRAVGDAVAIIDGKVETLWDVKLKDEPAYQAVADALSKLVKAAPISDSFLHYEAVAGRDRSFEERVGGNHTWDHLFVNIKREFVVPNADIIPSKLSVIRSTHDVMLRGLQELTLDAIDTTLELIAQGTLYRGVEQKFVVEGFRKLKVVFDTLKPEEQDVFVWANLKATPDVIARCRGSAVGTLLQDLSEGKDLEHAVKAFETMMGAANYKRPTALVTPTMITKAKEQLQKLGLTSALDRRHAKLADITVNNILFADRSARKVMGDVFDDIAASVKANVKNLDKIEEVTIDRFITEMLPKITSLEVLLENEHRGNLVSLIAPVDPTAGNLFKWDNKFSWSYNGEFADSIKERVKAAGGSVVGDLCCRLAWDYTDDLDFHMYEPNNEHIYFGSRSSWNGGKLDVDANGMDGLRPNPVENIFYAHRQSMEDGIYTLKVNNYNRRSSGAGFAVELEFDGETYSMGFDGVLKRGEGLEVARIKVTKGSFELISSLPTSKSSKNIWGLSTQTYHKVNVMMLSPNFWDDKAVGNKHFFFMLDSAANDSRARGFFNEFLKEDLNAHRKVIEVVGSKLAIAPAVDQLSGVGFSSTQRNTLVCRVKGSFTRTIKLVF